MQSGNLFSGQVSRPIRHPKTLCLLHPGHPWSSHMRGTGESPLALALALVERFVGERSGWFDDTIGLSARAYILFHPNALYKPLLVPHILNPWIKILTDPRAYASSPHWSLSSMTKPHSHAPLQNINVPLQYAYASPSHWLPQSWSFFIPSPFLL